MVCRYKTPFSQKSSSYGSMMKVAAKNKISEPLIHFSAIVFDLLNLEQLCFSCFLFFSRDDTMIMYSSVWKPTALKATASVRTQLKEGYVPLDQTNFRRNEYVKYFFQSMIRNLSIQINANLKRFSFREKHPKGPRRPGHIGPTSILHWRVTIIDKQKAAVLVCMQSYEE